MSEKFEKVDPKNQDDVAAALALLERTRTQQAKQRDKLKNDPEAKARAAASAKRRRVRDQLIMRKAIEAGIVVTEEEIELEMAG